MEYTGDSQKFWKGDAHRNSASLHKWDRQGIQKDGQTPKILQTMNRIAKTLILNHMLPFLKKEG